MRYGLVILILILGVYPLGGCGGEEPSPRDSTSSKPSRHPAPSGANGHQHGSTAHELGCVSLGGTRLRVQRLGAIQDGAALGFNVIGDATEETLSLAMRLESADGNPVSDTVRVSLARGAGHGHIEHRGGQPLPARLVLEAGETASLDLKGRAVDLHAGHHHGIVARATGGENSIWLELKLHDDKGDLELWLYRDLKEVTPFDLPLGTSIQAEFPEMSRTVTLGVRNREQNEDEGGQPNVRAGKTNYFIFPGDSGQDPSRLQGRTFLSSVKISFAADGVAWASASFLLVPHAHADGGHDHDPGKDHREEHSHEHTEDQK